MIDENTKNPHLKEGLKMHKQGRLDLAEKNYLAALNEDFDNIDALFLLGTVFIGTKRLELAAQLLMRVVSMTDEFFEAWNNLGNCFKAVNREDDAKQCWQAALNIKGKSDIEYADIWNNLGTLHVNSGKAIDGIKPLNKALELNPTHPDANWNLALVQLELGRYSEGFPLYSWGYKTRNRLYRNYGENVVDWKGEKDSVVAVWGEQGIGDEMLFASIINDLAKDQKKVIFDCHPRLIKIFKNSFPSNVVCYPTRKDDMIEWPEKHPDLKYKCAIGDLGTYYRTGIKDFPAHTGYLKADPERVEYYKKKLAKLGDKPKVGISWTGGYVKTRSDYRSIPLDKWGDVLKQDVDFISLQYTPNAYKEVADANDKFDVNIHHWPSAVECWDYHETAALVEALDCVVTVNTAVHHLAGGLGKECYTLTPVAKAWRYWSPDEDNKTIPWYPSVTQFQQEHVMDWNKVMRDVSGVLEERFCEVGV